MPIKIIKPQQKKYLSPDDMVNTSFSSNKPSVEFSRYLNHYLEIMGDNLIIEGLFPSNVTFTDTSVSMTIGPGKLIQDLTIIETYEDSILTKTGLSNFSYPDEGSLLVYTDYAFMSDDDTERPDVSMIMDLDEDEFPDQQDFNPFGFSIEYYDGSTVSGWDVSKNLIVLSKIDYEKAGGIITSAQFVSDSEFIINGVLYNVRGSSGVMNNIVDGGDIT